MGRRRAASKRKGEGGGSKRRRTSSNPKKKENVKDTRGESTRGKISKPEASAASSGNECGIVHPLLIDHILEKIFQHICSKAVGEESAESSASILKNVQNFRFVCKQWKDTATRVYLRNRAPMLSFGEMWGPCLESPDEKMQKFLDVMKGSDQIPIQRYTIDATFFVKENQKLLKDFMRICGPDTVELRLSYDNASTMKFTRRSFPDLNLMKLKTLTFQYHHSRHVSSKKYETVYLIEMLLNAAEALQEFDFSVTSGGGDWSQGVGKRFGECISKRIPKTVKILRLDLPFSDLHLNALAESELKLEEFKLDGQCNASSKVIRKFFEKQTTTLKVLKIFEDSGAGILFPSVPLDFPRFEELRHLELDGGIIQKFSYPTTFPKLACLNVKDLEAESTFVELLSSAKKGLSLKEIYLPYEFPQASLVKKVAQCFPNITKLHVSSSKDFSETMQQVFVYFDNIEELYVSLRDFGEFNADSLFSGVSERDCGQIKDGNNFDIVNLRDVQHQPSILNLTKLKKLVLDDPHADSADERLLTDFSAHFVFLKMASLNELHSRYEMSSKYVDLLREKLKLKLIEDDSSDVASDHSFFWDSDTDSDSSEDNDNIFDEDMRILFGDFDFDFE